MEIKAQLLKPYTEGEKTKFITTYCGGHKNNYGYIGQELDDKYVALGYTDEEIAEQEAEKEQERKSKLKMTKQDFFLYVLQPYNITYSALNTALATNDTLNACFNLCNHIYRYDTNFMSNIKTMLEAMTQTEIDEEELMTFLDEQFEAHNAED